MTYSNYKNERDIIEEALENFVGYVSIPCSSLIDWFSTDEIVKWFVEGFCNNDYGEVRVVLGNENDYNQIIDYYKRHCM